MDTTATEVANRILYKEGHLSGQDMSKLHKRFLIPYLAQVEDIWTDVGRKDYDPTSQLPPSVGSSNRGLDH